MLKEIIYYIKNRGTGVNQYATVNQSIFTLIREFFNPELGDIRMTHYWAMRIRGSGY